MDKIDMKDKFFHGVMWDSLYNSERLIAFKEILNSGYLVSPAQKNNSINYENKIFLSVYKN